MEIYGYYTCVTGDKIAIPFNTEHKITKLNKIKWEPVLICPITQSYIKDPVLLSETGNTYDREAIIKWLSVSDRDPLTNEILYKTKLIPNYLLKTLLYRIEEKDDCLLFHDISCLYKLAQFQTVSQFLLNNDKKIKIRLIDKYSKVGTRGVLGKFKDYVDISFNYVVIKEFKDCVPGKTNEIVLKNLHKILKGKAIKLEMVSSEIKPSELSPIAFEIQPDVSFNLMGINELFKCPISGNYLENPFINTAGITFNQNTVESYSNWIKNGRGIIYDTSGRVSYHELGIYNTKFYKNNIIKQICDELNLKNQVIEINDFNTALDSTASAYYERIREYIDAGKKYDPVLSTKTLSPYSINKERCWEEVQRVSLIMINLQNEIKILTKVTREFLEKNKDKQILGRNHFMKLRRQMNVPSFNGDDDPYGVDFSFLDLSNMIIERISFKNANFNCTDLSGVVFLNCTFYSGCKFIGTIFTNCKFVDCKIADFEYFTYKTVNEPQIIQT
ncbi:WD repeat, SAm and U-box domain-containing protein [Pacmanvirus S19]|nr:WD repeat, SAm and U-box domain-containing protein [Pacmanvirus S19]